MVHINQMITILAVVCQNKLIKKTIIIAILSFYLCLTACASSYLKKEDIKDLKVEYDKIDNSEYITIEGIPFHSALTPTQFLISDKGDCIDIKVKLELARNNLGLPFYIKIKLRDKVKYISLGENNDIIWKRH